MGEQPEQHVLGQKASAAQRALEARGMSPAKALRRALSRTAVVQWNLAMQAVSVGIETLDQDDTAEVLGESDLLVLLDGPDGAIGFAGFDRQIVTSLVEVQTLLQVTSMPVDDRPLTATDAAMTGPLINDTLERFEDNLDTNPLRARVGGFRFGALIEDARSASLLLTASEYRVFRLSVDVGLGKRQGEMQFILPDRAPKASDQTLTEEAGSKQGPHETMLSKVPARLDAVLCQVQLPLNKARQLKPGDLIPLPSDALGGAELLAAGGVCVAGGRLGQINGFRAVRLVWPVGTSPMSVPAALPTDQGVPDAVLSDSAETATSFDPPDMDAPIDAIVSFEEEDLPDLPPLDFGIAETDDAGTDATEDGTGDFDFGAAPMGDEMEFAATAEEWPTE